MAITRVAKRSKVEAFEEAAPDARQVHTMRGHKRPLAMTLPPELIEEYDDIARVEVRSRARMMEVALREWAAQYRATKTTRQAAE
jgi:hypothetical protein